MLVRQGFNQYVLEVFRKCTTHIDIILRINQPKETADSYTCFLETAKDFACLNVFYDALEATIIEMFGYDASLCGIDFEFKTLNHQAILFSFNGYDQKLPEFAQRCIETIIDLAKNGFRRSIVDNSIEKMEEQFTDMCVDVDNHSRQIMNLLHFPH